MLQTNTKKCQVVQLNVKIRSTKTEIYSWSQKLQNLQNVDYFTK